jgi:hypothetical protein
MLIRGCMDTRNNFLATLCIILGAGSVAEAQTIQPRSLAVNITEIPAAYEYATTSGNWTRGASGSFNEKIFTAYPGVCRFAPAMNVTTFEASFNVGAYATASGSYLRQIWGALTECPSNPNQCCYYKIAPYVQSSERWSDYTMLHASLGSPRGVFYTTTDITHNRPTVINMNSVGISGTISCHTQFASGARYDIDAKEELYNPSATMRMVKVSAQYAYTYTANKSALYVSPTAVLLSIPIGVVQPDRSVLVSVPAYGRVPITATVPGACTLIGLYAERPASAELSWTAHPLLPGPSPSPSPSSYSFNQAIDQTELAFSKVESGNDVSCLLDVSLRSTANPWPAALNLPKYYELTNDADLYRVQEIQNATVGMTGKVLQYPSMTGFHYKAASSELLFMNRISSPGHFSTTLLHELGHLAYLEHNDSEPNNLMNSFGGTSNTKTSAGQCSALQSTYSR